jgi:ribose transport system substrate-binding protein
MRQSTQSSILAPADSVQAVRRACSILKAFPDGGSTLRLRDICAKTDLHKATVSRLLRTLESEGLVERVGIGFRTRMRPPVEKLRIGFATRGSDTPFSLSVTESVQRAAVEAGLELITVSSHRSPRAALRNVETLVGQEVRLVIEFQSHERLAPLISSRFLEAGIPVIAVEIPYPGATYFGANNFQAGQIGGRALGRWIQKQWNSQLDRILLLEEIAAGPLAKLRVEGMLAGLRESLPSAEQTPVVEIDAQGSLEKAFTAIRRQLRLGSVQRTAILAGNDPMALGAIRAFEESGRSINCAVMSQNASAEARAELRRARTPLVASVAYFPERYGDRIIELALTILAGQPAPPAVFTKHELITAANVDRLYPMERSLPQGLSSRLI